MLLVKILFNLKFNLKKYKKSYLLLKHKLLSVQLKVLKFFLSKICNLKKFKIQNHILNYWTNIVYIYS